MPYGDKSIQELYEYSKKIIDYLYSKNVDIIVIACGTVSANLYDILKKEVKVPIYSVMSELNNYFKEQKFNKTLVLATTKTIDSHVFKKIVEKEVIEVACPKLVPLIESNNIEMVDKVLDEYIPQNIDFDSLVLGCTHYPIIKELIMNKINKNVKIIDMGEILAKRIKTQDSFKKVDLYFSKRTEGLNKNVNNILKNM